MEGEKGGVYSGARSGRRLETDSVIGIRKEGSLLPCSL